MCLQVKQFKQSKESSQDKVVCFAWSLNLRLEEPVHIADTKQNPIVRRVLEDVDKRHSLAWEPVHQQRFQLALDVVAEYHCGSNLLSKGQWLVRVVDLFPKRK
jgi:hypothetical protein